MKALLVTLALSLTTPAFANTFCERAERIQKNRAFAKKMNDDYCVPGNPGRYTPQDCERTWKQRQEAQEIRYGEKYRHVERYCSLSDRPSPKIGDSTITVMNSNLGTPMKVTTTETAHGTSETWVYYVGDDIHVILVFTNGTLSVINR